MTYEGRPRLLSNADLGIGRSMLASGFTTRQVAAHLNVSQQTIRTRIKVRKAYKQPERRW